MSRCDWAKDPLEIAYHDTEWGKVSKDDAYLFEMLVLEGMQAGLSWITILKKREAYKKTFHQLDIEKCSRMSDEELEAILLDTENNIIRNKLKVKSIKNNAQAFLAVQKEFGSFYQYIWSFVPKQEQIINHYNDILELPAQSELSEKISKDMKKRGFKFVGPVIIYSYLQAIGVIDDHIDTCPYK